MLCNKLNASSATLAFNSSSTSSSKLEFMVLVITEARNLTAPADSMERLLVWDSEAMDLRVRRHWSWRLGEPEASLRRFWMTVLSTGDLGVGIRWTPWEALTVHQAWMRRRRVWLGVRSGRRGCLVTGHVWLFEAKSHFSMLWRS